MPAYVCVSDVHFGHKNTPTKHIIESFKRTILTEGNKDLDALFIAGDLFDHLLYLNTPEAQQVIQFFHHLLNYCQANDIALKVLEGTPSHDWYQSSLLVKINDVREHKANLRYFKTLDIEFCEKLQKHILYIPDEWCNNQEELDIQIRTRLMELNIKQVDISILHGAFRYQAKGVPTSSFLYDESYFLNLTRGFIHIGHYHIHTNLDRIVAQGSLERLAHNEEEPKGCVRVDNDSWVFLQNTQAYTYKTINLKTSTDLTKLDKLIQSTPANSHIRLLMKPDHPFNALFKELTVRYHNHHLKKLIKDPTAVNSSVAYILSEEALSMPDHFVLESNVHEAVIRSIELKHSLSISETKKLHQYASVLKAADQPLEEST
jgi:hypothetical protein